MVGLSSRVLAWRKTSPTCSSPGHFRRAFHSHASLKTCPILSMPSASSRRLFEALNHTPPSKGRNLCVSRLVLSRL